MQPKTSRAAHCALAFALAAAFAPGPRAQGASPPSEREARTASREPAASAAAPAPAPANAVASLPAPASASTPAAAPAPGGSGRDPFLVSPHFRQNGNRLWSGAQVLPGEIRLRALINTGGDRIAQVAFGKDIVLTVRNGDEIAVPKHAGLFRVGIGKDGVTLQSTSTEEKISVR